MRYRIHIPALTNLWVPALCLILAAGCSHEEPLDPPETETFSEIHFFSSAQTRAAGNGLVSAAKVRIYPYHRKEGVTAPIIANGKDYTADTGGTTLTPAGSDEDAKNMILPAGTFGFYAISTNSSDTDVPTFSTTANKGYPENGKSNSSVALANGIDYLHVATEQIIKFGTEQNIPLHFKHAGTQVQLTIQFGESACAETADAAAGFVEADVWVQQTNTKDAYMYLSDGQIRVGNNVGLPSLDCGSDANSLNADNMAKMPVVKDGSPLSGSKIPANQIATYNMLPLASTGSPKMWVKVVIQNLKVGDAAATTHTYTGKLDASKGWNPGESNRYTLILKGNEIQFSNVTVEDWTSGSTGMVGDVTDSNQSQTNP